MSVTLGRCRDDGFFRRFASVEDGDQLTVAQDGDAVGESHDLFQVGG
jgi:hypothetical protein